MVEATLGGVSEANIAALFALLPIAVVVLVAHFDFGGAARSGAIRLLAPALAGLAGALFLLPVMTPRSWRQAGFDGVVVLGVVLAAIASLWMYRLLREITLVEAAVVCCLANAVFFFAASLASSLIARAGGSEWGWSWKVLAVEAVTAICFDLPQVLLLLWLMREVAPERFAARYFVIPLLTVMEGYALLGPEFSWMTTGGAVLMVFGAWRLMTASQREEEPGLMLR
jgi:uncharacterized membrane protein